MSIFQIAKAPWAEPFTRLRLPKFFNLRTDPYEFADVTANTYCDWHLNHVYVLYAAQFLADQGADARTNGRAAGARLPLGRFSPCEEEMVTMAEVTLASWNDGSAKAAIIDFVARVTKEGGKDYVPPAERIATFDNDGTLWNEQPLQVQVFFLADRIKQLAAKDPSIVGRQPFKAFVEHDFKTLLSLGKQGIAELFFATHAGMSDEEFAEIGRAWFESAKHPKYGCPFTQVTFKPQVELLAYLRENGFKTYIVTGGGVDFVRLVCEQIYGIPREQVIGSSIKLRVEMKDGRPVLMKTPELGSFNDREVKVQNIGLQIGRRPILAFGNSDGDLAMLRYTKSGPGARLALLLHHDDAEREAAYDREFVVSPLAEALDKAAEYGITVVSVKRDWRVVFG